MKPESYARISACGNYRYVLSRRWEQEGELMVFVMLNPSTADATEDDPTIRRCIGFAKREGYAGILVLNLFAYRATSPKDMKSVGYDAIGPDNYAYWKLVLENRDTPIVCAWGEHGRHLGVANVFLDYATSCGASSRLRCLGKNKGGQPKHPLYQAANAPLEAYP